MRLEPFAMERMQSTYENHVDFNLSESGVHPLRLGDLVEEATARDAVMREGLRYTQSNGTAALRDLIATWNLVEPGDDVVFMVPSYMQTWGLARAVGGVVREWPLVRPSGAVGWRMDTSGARFDAADLDRVAAVAARHGAWILHVPIMAGWLDGHGGLFSYAPPDAGAIVYVRDHHDINSTLLVQRLREQKSVLIVPGDHFGTDGYLTIGDGDQPAYLCEGLGWLHDLLTEIAR